MDLVRAVAFLLAAGSALGATLALGGAFSDKLDIFAQATPLWLAASLAALALQSVAGFGTGRGTATLAIWTLALCAFLMGPDVIARLSAPRAAPARQTIKVIQFNVWDRNRDPAATARWILAEAADVVVLEETGEGAVPALLTRDYPYRTQCGDDCATIILSKSPPVDGGVIAWAGLGPRHGGAWASFGQGADAYTVAGTHYRWPVPAGPQEDQARRFAQAIARFDRQSLIVAGDFNLNPWSFGLRRQDARFAIPRITHATFTWPAGRISHWRVTFPFPFLAVDQIYAGHGWRPVSIERGPALGSDHYPIVAVLTR